jgi:hypothetical protein
VSCEPIRELLEPYTLGLLDEQERTAVETHLAECADCRKLLADYEAALAGLPDALALASPLPLPPSLKDRLLRAIGAGAEQELAPGPVVSARPQRRLRALRRTLLVVGATVLVLAVAATAALSVALDRERTLRERFAGLYDDQEIVLEVVDGQSTKRTLLRPHAPGSRAYGKLFANPAHREVVVMAARLPDPGGQAYRIWLTEGGRTFSPGALRVNELGFGLLVFEAQRQGPRYDAVRVVLQSPDARTPAGVSVLSSPG